MYRSGRSRTGLILRLDTGKGAEKKSGWKIYGEWFGHACCSS